MQPSPDVESPSRSLGSIRLSGTPKLIFFWLAPALLTGLSLALLASPSIPLGYLGEWVWNRRPQPFEPTRWIAPALAFLVYCFLIVHVDRLLCRRRTFSVAWGVVLWSAGALVQFLVLDSMSPTGIERYALSVYHPACSGYFTVAKANPDIGRFLAEYETWISAQDSYHIGTHPPGLFVSFQLIISEMDRNRALRDIVLSLIPNRYWATLESLPGGVNRVERASIGVAVALTWLILLATGPCLYQLVRRLGGSCRAAFWILVFWPMIPAGPTFLPLSDCLFPMPAVLICLLAVGRKSLVFECLSSFAAGAILAVGLSFSLAFLVIVPILVGVKLSEAFGGERRWDRAILGLGSGILGVLAILGLVYGEFSCNLPAIWLQNLAKHRGFYAEMPRTYWAWVGINLLEFAIVVGPPVALAALAAVFCREPLGSGPSIVNFLRISLVTFLLLNFSGRNLSEAARLWVFLTPLACLGIAPMADFSGFDRRLLCSWLVQEFLIFLLLTSFVEPLLPVAGF